MGNLIMPSRRRLALAVAGVVAFAAILVSSLFLPSEGHLEFAPMAGLIAGPLLTAILLRPFVPAWLRQQWLLGVVIAGEVGGAAFWYAGRSYGTDPGLGTMAALLSMLFGGVFLGVWIGTAPRWR